MATTYDKMKEDSSAYFTNTKVGDSMDFGGGKLTRTTAGASYTDPMGHTYQFDQNTPLETIAQNAPGISNEWTKTYGPGIFSQDNNASGQSSNNNDLFSNDLPPTTQMQVDTDRYFYDTPIGTTSQFAGGTLTRTSKGAIFYDPTTKKSVNITQDMSFDDIAKASPSIAKTWGDVYGYKIPTDTSNDSSKPSSSMMGLGGNAPAQNLAGGSSSAGYNAPAGASVQQRLLDLLDKDNPYLVRARNSAIRSAAGRGLQNTSMAGTAGEAAAIDAAANIAGKDADLFANLYSQERGGEIESSLSNQQANQQGWLYKLQGDISANLTKLDTQQQLMLQSALKRMDNEQQMRMAQFEATTASKLSSQKAAEERMNMISKIDAENTWENSFLDKKIALESSTNDTTQRQNISSAMGTIQSEYQGDYVKIMSSPDYETPADRQSAIDQLNGITTARINNLSAIYNEKLDWTPNPNPYTPPKDTTATTTVSKDDTINNYIKDNGIAPADFNNWKSTMEKNNPGVFDMLSGDQIVNLFSRQYTNNYNNNVM